MRGIPLYISSCTSQPQSRGGKSHLAGRYAKKQKPGPNAPYGYRLTLTERRRGGERLGGSRGEMGGGRSEWMETG
ncbi:hypothetical protein JMJ77_0014519 [Colletotrichum scovillei]|uniref:Uncharacterized protein n=1 Tax=Colletotrichum scovillei TaxID=1209932 RepID=A0A9P7R3M9_9PEZI|nr:hypothetical protein JMJ77_0014519 [Colletotrichum scovillei]KAG7066053.1 hypothetical protein JMJ78_0012791 [Colletotrichum scovillei]KAG7068655.1 hypothetical protein JMJ76_0008336 [Colletotrichum scovillei]